MNVITLVGRLGSDPRLATVNEKSVASFSLATDDGYGEHKVTTWHRIVIWGKQADSVAKYLKKGSKAAVTGSLRKREYEEKETKIKKEAVEVIADQVQFLDPKESAEKSDSWEDVPF